MTALSAEEEGPSQGGEAGIRSRRVIFFCFLFMFLSSLLSGLFLISGSFFPLQLTVDLTSGTYRRNKRKNAPLGISTDL